MMCCQIQSRIFFVVVTVALSCTLSVHGFTALNNFPRQFQAQTLNNFVLNVHKIRDADIIEQMVGGVRYALVPMPESMKATTAYVGNLCEFVNDNDLSNLFAQISTLHSIPSCVVRKPDTTSLQYGFVSFPNEREKDRAIMQFHGYEWRGRRLKVECIRDHPKRGSVRIPEQLVEYVYGRTPRSAEQRTAPKKTKKQAKRRFRLSDEDKAEFERATRKGYLTVSKPQNRKVSSLVRVHREWSESKDKPQIVLYKSVGDSTIDEVIIDLSTTLNEVDCIRLKSQILHAAAETNMDLCATSGSEDSIVDDLDAESCLPLDFGDESNGVDAIMGLSSIVFGGVRSHAKSMASQLAELWEIPIVEEFGLEGAVARYSVNDGRNKKKKTLSGKRLSDHRPRRRGGGHRQAW